MKQTTNSTALNIVLCVVTMLALIALDVVIIVALSSSPLWKTSVIEATFWSFVLLGVVAFITIFVWEMWKEVFNK